MQTCQLLNKAGILFCIQHEHALTLSPVLLTTQAETQMDPKKRVLDNFTHLFSQTMGKGHTVNLPCKSNLVI